MKVRVYKDYHQLSVSLASEMIDAIQTKPDSFFCLATGDTPKLAYPFFVEKVLQQSIDISKCFFVGLDEWLGIPPQNEGSCHYFLYKNVFSPLGIKASQIHLFNALAKNLQEECETMNRVIEERGGIDFMVLGIGMNGHVGFNEPGVEIENKAHVISLDESTKTVGQKYFREKAAIQKGITLGIDQVMKARQVFMLANGKHKAGIVNEVLDGAISNRIPASLIRLHENAMLCLDEEAASTSMVQKMHME